MKLTEILLVAGIIGILALLSIPIFQGFYNESDLTNTSQEIISLLRSAQNKTLASEMASSWGVYFSTSSGQLVLFKGSSYLLREASFDQTKEMAKRVEISDISLAGGGEEVVFERILGTTQNPGTITIGLKDNPQKTEIISLLGSGKVFLGEVLEGVYGPPSLRDSRHVHFDYSRQIATSSENLLLVFEEGTEEVIIIAQNLEDEQIFWQGEVLVAGSLQQLKIHSHRLNDPLLGALFCLHRDARHNDKSFTLSIENSPDSGTLLSYNTQGEAEIGTSIYASNLEIQ